ncbi:MAG: hypothetical protein H6810_04065 [Phycisphaeraceae bacterium]|nr:MAG: hypothetical protein H6810_04065 [Phycisphaeraceae bacterium]
MIPNAAEIARRRVTATLVFRCFSFIPWLISLVPITFLANTLFNSAQWDYRNDGDMIMFGIIIAVLLGAGLLIWALAPWAARRAIPVPRVNTCPGCRYKLQGLNAPQCPECGLMLTPEYLSPDLGPERREPDTVLLRQISMMIIRSVGELVSIPLAIWLTVTLSFLLLEARYHDERVLLLIQVIVAGLGLLVAAASMLLARRIAILMVPSRAAFEAPGPPAAPPPA